MKKLASAVLCGCLLLSSSAVYANVESQPPQMPSMGMQAPIEQDISGGYKLFIPGKYKVEGLATSAIKELVVTKTTIEILPQGEQAEIDPNVSLTYQIANLMHRAEPESKYYKYTNSTKQAIEMTYEFCPNAMGNTVSTNVLVTNLVNGQYVDLDNPFLMPLFNGTYKVVGKNLKTKNITIIKDKATQKVTFTGVESKKTITVSDGGPDSMFFGINELLNMNGDGGKAYELVRQGLRKDDPGIGQMNKAHYKGTAYQVATYKKSQLNKSGFPPAPANVPAGMPIYLQKIEGGGKVVHLIYVINGDNVKVAAFNSQEDSSKYSMGVSMSLKK